MHKKLLSAVILVLIASTPSLAAAKYFVVQKASDMTCHVSTTKPHGTTTMMVGTTSYKTKAAATAAMKAAAECKK